MTLICAGGYSIVVGALGFILRRWYGTTGDLNFVRT
jgi:hypothetical protein